MQIKKRGVSAVVATVLLIALTLTVVAIVWTFVNKLVEEKIQTTESCGILNEVELNPEYTCYNQTAGDDEIWFSINVGEVENIDDILVSISGQGTSVGLKIKQNVSVLKDYSRQPATGIPGKNQGITYIYTLPSVFTKIPDLVEIAPIIKGEQCAVSSSLDQFDLCSALA